MTLLPKDPPQPRPPPLHLLPLLIDFVRPLAELVERDRGRFVEGAAIEEELAHDRAEEAARTVERRCCAVEEDFVARAGAAVLPQHPAFGIDVAEGDAGRRLWFAVRVRDGAHVRPPDR